MGVVCNGSWSYAVLLAVEAGSCLGGALGEGSGVVNAAVQGTFIVFCKHKGGVLRVLSTYPLASNFASGRQVPAFILSLGALAFLYGPETCIHLRRRKVQKGA
jgi:hypothetical protein